MSDENNINDTNEIPDMKAIFNRSQIEDINLYKIENIKTNFMLNYSSMDIYEARAQLSNILDAMQQIIEKYYQKELAEYKQTLPDGKKYNFSELKQFIIGGYADDRDIIRLIYLSAFNIYDHFAKMIGLEIAMYKSDPKKKALERLYSVIPNKNKLWYSSFYEGYYSSIKKYGYADDLDNFIPYSISKMPDFDLDCHVLVIGTARVGKSTLMLEDAIKINGNRQHTSFGGGIEYMLKNDWLHKNILWDGKYAIERLDTANSEVLSGDEMMYLSDRRKSLSAGNVDFTAEMQKKAYNNNILYSLIQNLTDLDARVYDKANVIYLVYERGNALVYIKSGNFPVIKSTYEFSKFQKDTYLLDTNIEKALHNLRKLRSYIGDRTFGDLLDNPIYKAYLPIKKAKKGEDKAQISTYSEIPTGF